MKIPFYSSQLQQRPSYKFLLIKILLQGGAPDPVTYGVINHLYIALWRGTLPETNSSHLKIGHLKKETIVFQPSIFRCEPLVFF